MAAGRLDVLMGLDAAEFTKGLTKAEYEAKKFQDSVRGSLNSVGTAFKTLIGVVTVRELVQGFNAIVSSLDDLDEAAQALGTTAVALSEFRRSALDSGVSAEKFDASLTKLSVKMADAATGGKESSAAFKALGISVTNSSGQLLSTDEILAQVADKFASFRDGAEKTALAVALFGKAGAAMIPFLNQGADGLRKFSGVTQEAVEAGKKLQAQFDILKANLSALGIEIASALIPFISKMIEEFIAARSAAGGFFGALKLLAQQSAETLADPGAKIQALDAELKKLEKTAEQSQGLFGDADNAERIKSLTQELKFLKEIQRNRALANAPGAGYRQEGFQTLASAPIPEADDSKKKLDNFLKEMERAANAEKDLANDRNKFLELANREGLISIADYYNARRAIVEEAARNTVRQYDSEIAALRKYLKDSADTPDERAETQGKINELLDKRTKILREAGAATLELGIQERQAGDAFGRQLNEINAQLLELTGHLEEAARIRFGDQFKTLRNQLTAAGDTAGLAKIDQLEKYKTAQAAFDEQQKKSAEIVESEALAEARLAVSRQAGAVTELGQLQLLGEARKATVAQLESIVQAQEAIANASGNPTLILNAKKARVALEELAATAEPLADKFNAIFEDAFGDAFASFVDGTKSAKDAFTDFAKSVSSQITKILAQNLAQSIVGGGNASGGGGIGGLIAQLLGGSKGTQFGSGGNGGMVMSWDGTAYATGTNYVPSDGLAMLHKGEAVIPAKENRDGSGSRAVVINQSFAPGTSRETVNQAAAAAAMQLARSSRRNN